MINRYALPIRSTVLKPLAASMSLILACSQKNVTFGGDNANAVPATVVADQQFPAGLISTSTTHYKPAFGTVEDNLSLSEAPAQTMTLTQATRPLIKDSFTQGHAGVVAIQDYSIADSAQLDLLIVLDNSGSMAAEEALLATGMGDFIASLNHINWQIGIITTDNATNPNLGAADGCELYDTTGKPGGQPIVAGDPQANSKFIDTITSIGAQGSNSEESILNVYKHLNGTCAYGNNSWLRPNALLGVVFITDEDGFCPEPIDPTTLQPTEPKDFDSTLCGPGQKPADLISLLTPPQRAAGMARVYSLTWHSSDMSCYTNAQRPANRVLQVMNGVGGFDNSICQSDYSATLAAISADASNLLTRQFTLPYTPIASSVIASIDGTPTTSYTVSGSTITLTNVTSTNNTLHLSYQHDPVPTFQSVTLSQSPDPATLQVAINGGSVAASAYAYNATTGLVQFATTPPDYAQITVQYRQGNPLPASFDVSSVKAETPPTTVLVNGQATEDFTWDTDTGTLQLPAAPADGAQISFSFVPTGAQVTSYPMAKSSTGAQPQSVTVTDAQTGSVIPVSEQAGALVFNSADVSNGREVVVSYDYGDSKTVLTQNLAYPPIVGSLSVKADDGSPACVKNIELKGQQLSFNCDASSLNDVAITYQYVAAHYSTFTVTNAVPPNASWLVYVDGVQIQDYTVSGQTVTIPLADTKVSSTVHIIVGVRSH